MGIVNQKPINNSKPEWRDALDRGDSLTGNQRRDLIFDVEANRRETEKIMSEIGGNINQSWDDIKRESGNVITDVKSQISKEKELLEKEIVNTYESYKQQVKDTIDNVKNEYENLKNNWKNEYDSAKEQLKKVKDSFQNIDWKTLGEDFQNGIVQFMKQNIRDTLDIDLDNTGVPIVRQIYNSALNIVGRTLNNNFPTPPSPYWATGTHGLFAQIGDILLYDKTGCMLEYTEICDYFNNMFPIRMLTAEVPVHIAQAVLSAKKEEIRGQKYAYEMYLSCRVLTDDVLPQIPIRGGAFLAVLKDGDNTVSINEILSSNTHLQQNDLISSNKVKLTFYLTTVQEMEFQSSPLINYVLDNPKPMEILMRSYELANPKGRIVMSQLENDVDMGKIVIPHMSFSDLVKFMDSEVGLYKTKYMEFYERGLYTLLNTSDPNEINVSCPSKESVIELFIYRHKDGIQYPRYIQFRRDSIPTYQASVDVKDTSIETQNISVWNDNTLFIKPQGKRNYYNNPMTRNTHVVRKVTGVTPLKKDNSKPIEVLSFDLVGFPISNVNPLTRVYAMDSSETMKKYRVCYKEIVVTSHEITKTHIKAFRRKEN